jgi:TRAP-type uncharacterized transport system substrate-binding protein
MGLWKIIVLVAAATSAAAPSGAAQESEARLSPQQQQQQQRAAQAARENYREQVNENVLFLMAGQPGASYETIAHDIATVVDDGLRMRVLPVLGNAAVQNISDVMFLRGVDLALTDVQVLNRLKQTKQYGPNLDRQLVYIAALSNDEIHLLVRPGINSIEDLQGKHVNFHNAGSATALLGPQVFKELQIEVQPLNMPQADALQKLRSGEIDATMCICAKPVTIFADLRNEGGFKLIEVPFAPALQDAYLPAMISAEDYPNLLPKGGKAETIASTTALISFNWPRGSNRYNRTAKFIEAMFSRFSDFQRPPRHPMWKAVNLAAVIPGWQRFPAAQDWLDRNEPPTGSLRPGLAKVLGDQAAGRPGAPTAVDNDQLFREFMDHLRKARN